MKLLFAFVFSFVLSGHANARALDQADFPPCETKLACATRSVVSLLPNWPSGFSRNEEPEGSGIVLSGGDLIATADHVLGPAKTARIRTLNGEIMDAEIVIRNPQTDIALLKINKKLPSFSFVKEVSIASQACAIGNSFGLDISLTCGVISAKNVSGVGFNKIEDFVQTDASVNPGMSGGALVNSQGQLVGMLSAIFTRQSDANIGVNFAVSANLLKRMVDDYNDDGVVSFRTSGLVLRPTKPISGSDTQAFIGAEVVRVQPDSIESISGIKVGDVILTAGGKRIKRAGAYEAAVALLERNEDLELGVLRDKKIIQIVITEK